MVVKKKSSSYIQQKTCFRQRERLDSILKLKSRVEGVTKG